MGAESKWIEPILDRFRFDVHGPRDLLNAVFYILKTGSQWRMLLSDYPPWRAAHYDFRKWRRLSALLVEGSASCWGAAC
ncbi:transposase [Salinibacter ruber]|jgi:putative transposase|uniref:Transposase n=1 Tax=Salinibacter ruber TaxID=146919 RepID=A0A9X2UN88_9BACT|nr:transposase [Salinibacter ruber]MCS3612493.1 transposase [Salinibacter ruber]MCS3616323.1 transposase [Salinibacter ruber]MCS3648315.1 transposase [Salinibacter ruber]MCS3784736.1 transposase [Salinibacter ruber]